MKAIPPLIGFGMLLIAISVWVWIAQAPYREGYEQRVATASNGSVFVIWVRTEPPGPAVTDTVYLDTPALDEEGP